eukprot:2917463-Rhodomonas_salina.1
MVSRLPCGAMLHALKMLSNACGVFCTSPRLQTSTGFADTTPRSLWDRWPDVRRLAQIGDVILPLWANDAQHLVKTMREALESEHVSRNLHNWIDLIFGYKQTGEEAAKADNVFHPMTYQGNTEWESLADDLERKAVREQ